MRRVRTTTAVLFLGALGGLVSGLLVSFGAVVLGPDAIPAGAPNVAEVVGLAARQGITVGTPLGVILGPLAYLGLGAGTPPFRLALLTGMAAVSLGIALAAYGGAPAGLAGGLIGFFAAAVLAGRVRVRAAAGDASSSPHDLTVEPGRSGRGPTDATVPGGAERATRVS